MHFVIAFPDFEPCSFFHPHARNPTPFVRPEWIVDSLSAGRLLPVSLACNVSLDASVALYDHDIEIRFPPAFRSRTIRSCP